MATSRQTKRLLLGAGVLALVIGVSIISVQRRNTNASTNSGGPALDSGFGEKTVKITFKVADSAGTGKAAYLDAFAGEDTGLVAESAATTGLGSLDLADGNCYTIQATDKDSSAHGSVVIAAGSATGCGDTAQTIKTANTDPIQIKIK